MQIFTERELELLISGLPEIDADEWRANTGKLYFSLFDNEVRPTLSKLVADFLSIPSPLDLVGYTATDPIVGYFWRAVRSFSHEERAKVSLQLNPLSAKSRSY